MRLTERAWDGVWSTQVSVRQHALGGPSFVTHFLPSTPHTSQLSCDYRVFFFRIELSYRTAPSAADLAALLAQLLHAPDDNAFLAGRVKVSHIPHALASPSGILPTRGAAAISLSSAEYSTMSVSAAPVANSGVPLDIIVPRGDLIVCVGVDTTRVRYQVSSAILWAASGAFHA